MLKLRTHLLCQNTFQFLCRQAQMELTFNRCADFPVSSDNNCHSITLLRYSIAARWRRPSSLGMPRLLMIQGEYTPAAKIRLLLMIIAPSWRGEFFEKDIFYQSFGWYWHQTGHRFLLCHRGEQNRSTTMGTLALFTHRHTSHHKRDNRSLVHMVIVAGLKTFSRYAFSDVHPWDRGMANLTLEKDDQGNHSHWPTYPWWNPRDASQAPGIRKATWWWR